MKLSALIIILAAALLTTLLAGYVKSREIPRGAGGVFVERNIDYETDKKI